MEIDLFKINIIIYVLYLFLLSDSLYAIYEKAGKPGIASLIPLWNIIVLLEIIKKPWWWLLLFAIPVLNVIFYIWSLNLLSKSFDKDEEYTLGLVLLPFVFLPKLAFSDAQYIHAKEKKIDVNTLEDFYKVLILFLLISFIFCGLYAISDMFIINLLTTL